MNRFYLLTLIALLLTAAARAQNDAVPLAVSGSGFFISDLLTGATAFGNRKYVWEKIPEAMEHWKFTEVDGGKAAQITVLSQRDGYVYLATDSTTPDLANGIAGWESQPSLALTLTDKKHTAYAVYRAACRAGKPLTIPQVGWGGGIVLAPALTSDAPSLVDAVSGPSSVSPASTPPGVIIDYLPASSHQFIGSPAIVILPDGTYVAAHDIFFGARDGNHTRIFRSMDRGASWQPITELVGQYWSNFFVHRGALYLFGTSGGFGHIVLRRSLDGGKTWTTPDNATSGALSVEHGMSCAPTPVVEAQGRLWKAFEINPPGARGRQFEAFVMSAPIDSDLLRADSWTHTNALPYRNAETEGNWLEGNAVVAPNGEIFDVLRISKTGLEKAALLHVSPDGRAIGWNPDRDRIDFPGGGVKFTIRYDPVSRRYWSLVNKQRNPDALRNVLALTSSPDLIHWTVEATLLQHPDEKKHAFQYVDWQFDGNDIVAVSRTSWDGDTYHNANYLTFHRIRDFRNVQRAIAP